MNKDNEAGDIFLFYIFNYYYFLKILERINAVNH